MDVSAQVAATPARRDDTVSGQPGQGSWWEWRAGWGWVERQPVPETESETGEESAA